MRSRNTSPRTPHLAENPKAIAQLYAYVAPVDEKIIRFLQLLGLDKRAPRAKTLQEILSEDDSVTERDGNRNGVTDRDE